MNRKSQKRWSVRYDNGRYIPYDEGRELPGWSMIMTYAEAQAQAQRENEREAEKLRNIFRRGR